MPNVTANGIQIEYETFGDKSNAPLLLITGWFSDLTLWPRGFCEELVGRGYRVIRYDNRDSGLSTRTQIDTIELNKPPYTMSDLAADAVGLLDSLGIAAAHISGFAMGGTIAQYVVIEYPDRVLSITLVDSGAGGGRFPMPDRSILRLFYVPFPTDPEDISRHHKKLFAAMAGSSFDESDYEARKKESVERGAAPALGDIQGAVNMAASGDRTEKLRKVQVPALIVHAEKDPLVSLEAA